MIQCLCKKVRNKKGFTLIELIVVIAILGILAGIAVPRFGSSQESAAIAAHNANVRTLESAAVLAVADNMLNVDWDGTTEEKGLKYVQTWPDVPAGVRGKKYKVLDTSDPANPIETEVEFGDSYTVKISNDGKIEVIPGLIKRD